jgi:PST family polysaccharide transporter
MLYNYNLDGALIAIALIPVVQVIVMLFIFIKVLKEYVQFRKLKLSVPLAKPLLAYTIMSVASTVLINLVEIDIRAFLANQLSESDAGIWTGMTTLSKNYMVFSGALFTLYVIPKFVGIQTNLDFRKEVRIIYKTLLPLFAVGMLAIYFMRFLFIEYIFIDFDGMAPLFKWQLAGDFIRLATLVLIHQFIAKKLVWNFVFTEVVSAVLFFGLSRYLVSDHGVEGVVMAHLARYIILFVVVLILLYRYFRKNPDPENTVKTPTHD